MAFEKNIYEIKFLFVVLIGIPLIASTNIDCGGRPFHCLNSTHFKICVDLGGGVSYTIDDFVIECPPPTVCLETNRYECELATTTSTTLKPTTALQASVTVEKDTTTEEIIVDTVPWSAGSVQHIELSTTVVTQETTTDASVIPLSTDTTDYETVNTNGPENTTIFTKISQITTISDQDILNTSNSADVSPTDIILTEATSDNLTNFEKSGFVAIVSDEIKSDDKITISNKTEDKNGNKTLSESAITEYLINIERNNATDTNTVNNSDISTNFTEKDNIFLPTPVIVTNLSTTIVQQTKSSLSERSVSTTDSSFVLTISTNTFNNKTFTTDSSATVAVNVNISTDKMNTTVPENASGFVSHAVSTTEFATVLNPSEGLVQDILNDRTNITNFNDESTTTPKELSTNSAIKPETNNGTESLINTIEFENLNTTQLIENIIFTTEPSTIENYTQLGNSKVGVTTENTVLSDRDNQYLERNVPADTTTVSTGTNYEEEQNTAVDIGTTLSTISIDLNKSMGSETKKVAEQATLNTSTIFNIENGSKNRAITTEAINYTSTKLNTTEINEIINNTLIVTADLDSPTTLTIMMEQLSNNTNNPSYDTSSTSSSNDVYSNTKDTNSTTTESLRTTIDTTTATILSFEFNDSTVALLQFNSTTEKQGPVSTTPITLKDIINNTTSSHFINALDTSVIIETMLLNGTKFVRSLNKSETSIVINHNDTSNAVVQLIDTTDTAQPNDTGLTKSKTNSVPSQSGFTESQVNTVDLPAITEQGITSWTESQVKNTKQITVNELRENTTLAASQADTEPNITQSIELQIVTPVESPVNNVIPEFEQNVTGLTDSQVYSAPAGTAGYYQHNTSQPTELPANTEASTAKSRTHTEGSTTEINVPQANTNITIAELSESTTHIQKSTNVLTESHGTESNTDQRLVENVGSEANAGQNTITVTKSQITAAQTEIITSAVPDILSPRTSVQLLESQDNTKQITTESSMNSEQGIFGIKGPQGNLDQITLAVSESQGSIHAQNNIEQSTTELSGTKSNTEQVIEQINDVQAKTEQNYAVPIGAQSYIQEITDTQANTQTSEIWISAPTTDSEIGITRPTISQIATEQDISSLNVSQSASQKSTVETTVPQPIIYQYIGAAAGQTGPEAVSSQDMTNTTDSIATSQQGILDQSSQANLPQDIHETTGIHITPENGSYNVTDSQVTSQQSTSNLPSSQAGPQQSALDFTSLKAPSEQDINGIASSDATSQQSTSDMSGIQVTTQKGTTQPTDAQTTLQRPINLAGSQTISLKGIIDFTYSESTSDSSGSQVSSQQGFSDMNSAQATPLLGIAEKADSQGFHSMTGLQATLQEDNKETTGSQTQGTREPIDSQSTSQQSAAEATSSLTTSKQSTLNLIDSKATSQQDIVATTGLQATTESSDSQVTFQQNTFDQTQTTLQQSTYNLSGQVNFEQGSTVQTITQALSEKEIGASTDTQAESPHDIAQQTASSQQNNNEPQTTIQQSNYKQDIIENAGPRDVHFVQSVAMSQGNKTQNVSQPSESKNITTRTEHSGNGLVESKAKTSHIWNSSSGSQDYFAKNTATVHIASNNTIANVTQFSDTKQISPQDQSIGQSGIKDSYYNKPTQHLQNNIQVEIAQTYSDAKTVVNTSQSVSNIPPTNKSSGIQDSLNLASVPNGTQFTSIYYSQNASDGSNKTKLTRANPKHYKINVIKDISKDNDNNINSYSEITSILNLASQDNVPKVTSNSNPNITENRENGILEFYVAPTASANANTKTVTEALLNDNIEYNIVTTTTSSNNMKLSDKNQQNSQATQENKIKVSAATFPINNTRSSDTTTMSYLADTQTANIPLVFEMSTITTATESTNKVETTATTATETSDAESSTPYPATENILSEQQFNCQGRPGGRYADNDDCSKFYICSGTAQTIVGSCPLNTVFSDIKKLCTRNLSHCIRNNEFKCTSSGRFADYLKPNIYYICMKKDQSFLRYKFQCQESYLLNRLTVTCYKNNQPSSQSASIDNSQSTIDKVSQEKEVQKSSKKKVKEVFECEGEGKFADPYNCRGYYICKLKNRSDETYRRKHKTCDQDEIFDKEKKKCVDASSSHECRYYDSFVSNIYFVRIKREQNFITYKLQCQHDYHLNMKMVKCERQIESSSHSESQDISKNTSDGVSQTKSSGREDENHGSFECEEEGKFANPTDCRRYYLCKEKRNSRTHERRFKRKQKKCGKHQVFREEEQRCIYSKNNRCV